MFSRTFNRPYSRHIDDRVSMLGFADRANSQTNKLTLGGVIMLKLTRIVVGAFVSFLSLLLAIPAAQQAVAQAAGQTATWVKIPGAANSLSIAADGTVWMVSTEKGRGGFMVYRRAANKTW